MALSSVPWAVDLVFGLALASPRTCIGISCVGGLGRALDAARQ
jgi:hypothetical protein